MLSFEFHGDMYLNLNCHDTRHVTKLVLCQVIVALGGVTEVHGHEVTDADDVAYGGKIARFLGLGCVTAVSPFVFHG